MKVFNHLLITMILCIGFGTHAIAQNSPAESLVGTWVLDYNATFSKMEMQMKVIFDSIPQSQKSTIEKNYRNRTMIFDANGNFRQIFPDGRAVNGSWLLEQNANTLVVIDPSGNRYFQRIKELNDFGLVLKMEDSGDSRLFVKELYFTKN